MAVDGLNLMLLNVGLSTHDGTWNWQSINSPFARIYYVKEGEARTKFGDKTYILCKDHLYLTPPFTLHDDECDSLFSLFYIHFYEKLTDRESIFDRYELPVEVEVSKLDLLLVERLLAINPNRGLSNFNPAHYDNMPTFSQTVAANSKVPMHVMVETQAILQQLISRFLEMRKKKAYDMDRRINDSLQYIHTNINKDLSIAELSVMFCLSNDHFIRLFKKEIGCTPLKYINIKKIEKAQLLLITTEMSIREVAMELSIDNISYFNRIFKQAIGKRPSEYRKEFTNRKF